MDSALALSTFMLLSNHHHHPPLDLFHLPKLKCCPHETKLFYVFHTQCFQLVLLYGCLFLTFYSWCPHLPFEDMSFLPWILVFCLLILPHGWWFLPSFSWEGYSPWRPWASPGSPSPLGWQVDWGEVVSDPHLGFSWWVVENKWVQGCPSLWRLGC